MVGKKLSHFEITAKIGEGGMGEVYQATDTKLNREVALKILPKSFSKDAERMARFSREAQLLASLNHPNIAAIYGLEETNGTRALVMELVKGEDLAEQISRGPIPLEEALPIALQIAAALEDAHEKGIIHRDLKPANVRITPEGKVKILDFGLAKALEEERTSQEVSKSPTLTMAATQAGYILGTAAYMSPEQAKGKCVDRRADIWAFGVVLFEMLTGKKAFPGEDVSDTLAAVLRSEIDWDSQKKIIPFPILQLLRRCLDRDSRNRLRDIGEARVSIQEYLADPTEHAEVQTVPTPFRRRQLFPWLLLALVILLAIGASVIQRYETPAKVNTVRFHIDAPEIAFSRPDSPVISPDGTQVALSGTDKNGQRQLWVRDMNSLDTRRLSGAEGATGPFWSPDSRFIGFFADDKLKKISPSGGISQSLADAPSPGGGTWNHDGVIVFSPGTEESGFVAEGPLYKVSASGGEARPVTTLENSPKEAGHLFPFFLPDDRHFLYLAAKESTSDVPKVKVGSLDSDDSRALFEVLSKVNYAAPGYLVFARGDSLVAQPFDLVGLKISGDPISIVETVSRFFWYANFSVSRNGTLVYRGGSPEQRLVWRDRSGAEIGQVGEAKNYPQVDLFEDEKRIGLGHLGDIWFYETASDVFSRFTFQGGQDLVCSPDNQQVVFASARADYMDLYLKSLGGGETQLLLASGGDRYPEAWSPDGRYIVFISTEGKSVYAMDVSDKQKEPRLLLETPFETDEFSFSPDGEWLAYSSTESGRWEVYVASFPDLAHKRQVSNAGGVQPIWSRDGEELFYLEISGRLMSAEIQSGSVLETGAPQELFQTGIAVNPVWNQYDVSKNGQFLLIEPMSSEQVNVVLNWPEELESSLSTGN